MGFALSCIGIVSKALQFCLNRILGVQFSAISHRVSS